MRQGVVFSISIPTAVLRLAPFSPYSDINVKDTSLKEALKSPLFRALQTEGLLQDDHIGGCTLYMNREKVEAIINADK